LDGRLYPVIRSSSSSVSSSGVSSTAAICVLQILARHAHEFFDLMLHFNS
jgi:hypothetical protein